MGDLMKLFDNKRGIFDPERRKVLDNLKAQSDAREREQRTVKLKAGANLFPKYTEADLDDVEYVREHAPDCLHAYSDVAVQLRSLAKYPATLILRGQNGPGKTHLASALVNHFCDEGLSAFYCRAIDFFTQVKSTFGAPGKTMDDLERRFRTYKLLVIDEIEIRSDSAWENNLLRSLIDARYASNVATVIITNKSEDEINAYFSPAIRDRIRDGGGVINCDWRSLRGAA
jgi:DNA replication protein DnaC